MFYSGVEDEGSLIIKTREEAQIVQDIYLSIEQILLLCQSRVEEEK